MRRGTLVQRLQHLQATLGLFVIALLIGSLAFAAESEPVETPEQLAEKLCAAAGRGATLEVYALLERGADINGTNERGWTALSVAAMQDQPEAIVVLLAAGADVDARGRSHQTALHQAESDEVIKLLLAVGANLEAQDEWGGTPLNNAGFADDLEVARFLLEAGANVNAGLGWRDTPLHGAANYENIELLKLLLDYGADINARNIHGLTPLHFAAKMYHPESVALFVARGAELNDLYAAAAANDAQRVQELLADGASPLVEDWEGDSPLEWAAMLGSVDAARVLIVCHADEPARKAAATEALLAVSQYKHVEMTIMALELGADASVIDSNDYTLFQAAISQGSTPAVRNLIAQGADVHAQDTEGRTPLHLAAQAGQTGIAILLLGQGAKPDAACGIGATPLHYAARAGQLEFAQLLLLLLAPVDARDNRGLTPLHWLTAASDGDNRDRPFCDAAALLIAAGADLNAATNVGYTPLDLGMPFKGCGTGQDIELLKYLYELGARNSERWINE